VRQIRMLRAMRRELETELRRLLHRHAGGTPDTAKELPADHLASSRPYHESMGQMKCIGNVDSTDGCPSPILDRVVSDVSCLTCCVTHGALGFGVQPATP
jgi:hypothetical protein